MSNKICPACNTKNDSGNLKCIKCSESIIYVQNEQEWTEEQNKEGFSRNYLLESFMTPSFFIRVFLGFTFAYIGIATLNGFMMGLAILVVGTFFIPKDNDYFNPDELFLMLYKKFKK